MAIIRAEDFFTVGDIVALDRAMVQARLPTIYDQLQPMIDNPGTVIGFESGRVRVKWEHHGPKGALWKPWYLTTVYVDATGTVTPIELFPGEPHKLPPPPHTKHSKKRYRRFF